jgi:outer membrane protein OmpA-like peptidoglycan-associated protein
MRSIGVFFLVLICPFISAQDAQEALPGVNMSYDEKSPVISPDGKILFLTITNHPQNLGGIRDAGDIWYSEFDGLQWSKPAHAGAVLNSRDYNAVAGFSADGQQLYLLSHYDGSGNAVKTQGISVSRKTSAGWGKPENIFIPYFLNKSNFLSGSMSPDGSVFVFAAEAYGSRVEDIYVARKGDDGKWLEPRNLGGKINTQFQELSPWMSKDGTTLYFSSNGRPGCKGFDVFFATRLDDTWTNWSSPESVPSDINSEGRELFFRQYPEFGFSMYTSTKNSNGYGEIKLYRPDVPFSDSIIIVSNPAPDTVVKIEEIKYEETNDKFVRVHGKITNAKTGEVISSAALHFESADSLVQSKTSVGEYKAAIASTQSYTVKVDAPGFVSSFEKLDLNTNELKELEMNFKLQPIELGTTVTLKSVLFMQSKPELLPQSYPELDLVVQFMKENPHLEIELSGHTDSRGSFRQLMALSQQRVNKVKSYLVSKGISSKRIVGKGYGGSKPIASNDSEETRMLNRRVEFVIKKL